MLHSVRSQRGEHTVGLKALSDQEAVEASEMRIVLDQAPPTEPLGKCRRDQLVRINRGEDLVERAAGKRRCDSGGLHLALRAEAAMPLEAHLTPCERAGHAFIVEGTVLLQPRDGCVDGVWVMVPTSQPLPDLQLGQFAPRQHSQSGQIGAVGHVSILRSAPSLQADGPSLDSIRPSGASGR